MSGYFVILVAMGLVIWAADVAAQREANRLEQRRQQELHEKQLRAIEAFKRGSV